MKATSVKSELNTALKAIETARTASAYKKAYSMLAPISEKIQVEINNRVSKLENGVKAPSMNTLHDLVYEIEQAQIHYPERWSERKSYLSVRNSYSYKLAINNID